MIKRNDLLLIVGLVLIIAVVYVIRSFTLTGSSSDYVQIRVDGEIVAEYSLSEDREEVFMAADGGYNKVVIKDGTICVSEADCPDRHCVKKGAVSGVNETIICLPHKLVIKLCGNDKNDVPDIIAH